MSYGKLVGLSGLEPPTSRLSGVRSNRLSYRPMQGFVMGPFLLVVPHSIFNLVFVEHRKINSTASYRPIGFLNKASVLFGSP